LAGAALAGLRRAIGVGLVAAGLAGAGLTLRLGVVGLRFALLRLLALALTLALERLLQRLAGAGVAGLLAQLFEHPLSVLARLRVGTLQVLGQLLGQLADLVGGRLLAVAAGALVELRLALGVALVGALVLARPLLPAGLVVAGRGLAVLGAALRLVAGGGAGGLRLLILLSGGAGLVGLRGVL